MKKIVLATSIVVSVLMLQACNDTSIVDVDVSASEMKSLDINVIYLDRRMLPPGAVLEVNLEDISKADAPSELIASQAMEAVSAPPFSMVLNYDAMKIMDKHRYNLRATIKVKNQLVMTSTTNVIPFVEGSIVPIEIKLERIAHSHTTDTAHNATFTDTYWKLMQLNGQNVQLGAAKKDVLIQFISEDNSVLGFSGCNTFKGHFEIDQGKLNLGPVAATQKMCMDGMDQEKIFLNAMGEFFSYSVQGESLTMTNKQGDVISIFKSHIIN